MTCVSALGASSVSQHNGTRCGACLQDEKRVADDVYVGATLWLTYWTIFYHSIDMCQYQIEPEM